MILDKAIKHGKEHGKPCSVVKAVDRTWRSHGSCEWCKGNSLYQKNKVDEASRQALKEIDN